MSQQDESTLQKRIVAITVAVTTLIVILLSVLIYQWVKMGVQNKRVSELNEKIAREEEILQNNEKDYAYYESENYLEWAVRSGGYSQP